MTGDTGRTRKLQVLVVLTLLLVFVAGGLVGAAVAHGRDDGPRGRPRPGDRRGPPPLFAPGSPLAERLELTDAQRDSIEKITTRERAAADSVFREMRHAMRRRFDSTMTAVNSVLTPEQRTEWEQVRREWRERERSERGDRRDRPRTRRGDPKDDEGPRMRGGPPPLGDTTPPGEGAPPPP